MTLLDTLKNRKRPTYPLDFAKVPPLESVPGKVFFRVLTSMEQETAIIDAVSYLQDRYSSAKERESIDAEIRESISNVYAAFALARTMQDEKGAPVFPRGQDLLRELTAYQLGALYNFYVECVFKEKQVEPVFHQDRIRDLSKAVAMMERTHTNLPNEMLAHLTREQLAELVIRLSMELHPA